MRPAIAFDFDGTITKDDKFPNIGPELMWKEMTITATEGIPCSPDGIHSFRMVGETLHVYAPATYIIQKLQRKFHIVIHTCRTGASRQMMVDWLNLKAFCPIRYGVDYEINRNSQCPEAFEKPFADVYLDNRGLRWTPELTVEDAIDEMIRQLPAHEYVPQKVA